MNDNNNDDWCHYSGMPSPMAYSLSRDSLEKSMNDMTQETIEPIEPIEPITFNDKRGSYTPIQTNELGIEWKQCSISVNDKKGTFRSLHYQTNPPQTKYVKVIKGSVIDFMLNLDTNELLYFTLDSNEALLIPHNMAHGFLTLEEGTIVAYMVRGEYNPESEHCIVLSSQSSLWHTIEGVKKVVLDNTDGNLIISDKDNLGK